MFLINFILQECIEIVKGDSKYMTCIILQIINISNQLCSVKPPIKEIKEYKRHKKFIKKKKSHFAQTY